MAIPTAKYIEVETFKSIYDLTIPDGYELDFQYFYGYRVDQVRNLIADWAKNYDYLFSVDSDIVLPKNTLENMIAANKDIISGLYIQRNEEFHILEVYFDMPNGGVENIPWDMIRHNSVVEIAACGMGCALIKSEVFRRMQYPHYEYKPALNHNHTMSEDIDFCLKARSLGFKVYADPSILCDHVGQKTFRVGNQNLRRYRELMNKDLLPRDHVEYMRNMNVQPKVIFDIGSSVLHWSNRARDIWPSASFYQFEAMEDVGELYEEKGFKNYFLGVLSDEVGRIVEFHENNAHPGGNTYYRQNQNLAPHTINYFNSFHRKQKVTNTIDNIRRQKNLPKPDLVKMDIQGAELDVLKGGIETFSDCKDFILELQHEDYNIGAPKREIIIDYMKSMGYELVSNFTSTNVDGDYHFRKVS